MASLKEGAQAESLGNDMPTNSLDANNLSFVPHRLVLCKTIYIGITRRMLCFLHFCHFLPRLCGLGTISRTFFDSFELDPGCSFLIDLMVPKARKSLM